MMHLAPRGAESWGKPFLDMAAQKAVENVRTRVFHSPSAYLPLFPPSAAADCVSASLALILP